MTGQDPPPGDKVGVILLSGGAEVKIVVKAEQLKSGRHEVGDYMMLTPVGRGANRQQEICGSGIFNLMGIKRPGTYTIVCTKRRSS